MLINNMIVGPILPPFVKVWPSFAVKAGLIRPSSEAIKDGGASSTILDLKAPKIIKRDFRPAARMAVHQKGSAERRCPGRKAGGVSIPMTEMVLGYG